MGGKRSGTRQYVYLCTAGLIIIALAACGQPSRIVPLEAVSCIHLQGVQDLIRQGRFVEAMRENEKILSRFPKEPPGDEALFNLGLIQVHNANPRKDYKKGWSLFSQLEKEFPASPLVGEAKIWVSLLEKAMERPAEQAGRPPPLQRVQNFIRRGDFEGALRENLKILAASPKNPPGDAALFSMGLIHLHYANPAKDYGKALSFFRQLRNEFSESPFAEEAKIWVGVLQAMEKAQEIDIEIEEKKKELTK